VTSVVVHRDQSISESEVMPSPGLHGSAGAWLAARGRECGAPDPAPGPWVTPTVPAKRRSTRSEVSRDGPRAGAAAWKRG